MHLPVSESGVPVEMFFSPGSYSETSAHYDFSFPLPEGSSVHGDKAYNVYGIEDELKERGIYLMPLRKKNSKRKYGTLTERGIRYKISPCIKELGLPHLSVRKSSRRICLNGTGGKTGDRQKHGP